MSNEVIQMTDVSVAYNGTPVLDSINFSLDVGEFCYVIGRTGAGKSSFLKLIYKDVNPTKGLVKVADFDLSNLADKKIPYLRRRLGVVFQDFQLLPDRNVFDN
ncbi:MAG: ATP-binding cassette domain-containing protein, partial [Balneolaceae bacterium]|nr:ATP-binding cassette domain-containing protein [Balneolaceae bacterium]